MKRYSIYIFDLDGTLFRGNAAIPDAVKAVSKLDAEGAQIRYLTNNSGQTRQFYQEKLARIGYPVKPEQIYSSAIGTAAHLMQEGQKSAFVVGEPGLISTLSEAGVRVVNAGEDGTAAPIVGEADAVVAGICRSFTYDLMNCAMQCILAGSSFVATNPDKTYPVEGGRLIPGAGSIVQAIATCSGATPFVVGKPNPFLVELVLSEAGCRPSDALVVGDRFDTDIESGRRAGCDTFLVLTGVETEAREGQPHGQSMLELC